MRHEKIGETTPMENEELERKTRQLEEIGYDALRKGAYYYLVS